MRALFQRLSGLDDVAEGAVRVIELFDKLAQEAPGLDGLVRSAAIFSECTAGAADDSASEIVRMSSEGEPLGPQRPDAALTHPVDGGGEVWLEREGTPLVLDELVIERFAAAVAIARRRARGMELKQLKPVGQELVELMIRRTADEAGRARAIQLLGLVPDSPVRVLAIGGDAAEVLSCCARPLGTAPVQSLLAVIVHGDEDLHAQLAGHAGRARIGIGPCVYAVDAWRSWHAARLAARFAGHGTTVGSTGSHLYPSIVFWDDLGGFAALAEYVPSQVISEIPDVAALDRLVSERTGPTTLAALQAISETESIRLAARTLHMHHSSVGQRLDHAEQVLGFPVRTAHGRNRLALALTLRRLRESADDPSLASDRVLSERITDRPASRTALGEPALQPLRSASAGPLGS